MADCFDGVRLKLQRAREQMDGLDADFLGFLNQQPYGAAVHFDMKTRELTVSVSVKRQPDPMWGVRIGEIVHNLRSALDHSVRELVIKATTQPPKTKQNQFPIFETEAGFDDRGVRKFLIHVAQDAIDLIKSEQPFRTGEDVKSPLWHLKELSDVDKHRTLHVTGTLLANYAFRFQPLVAPSVITPIEIRSSGPIQQDAVLWRGHIGGPVGDWPFASREIDGHLTVNIAFDQGTPAVGGWKASEVLRNAESRTTYVLKRIADELFGISL